MKNLEGLLVKAGIVAVGVIAAGYIMNTFSTVGVVSDAKKGFGA